MRVGVGSSEPSWVRIVLLAVSSTVAKGPLIVRRSHPGVDSHRVGDVVTLQATTWRITRIGSRERDRSALLMGFANRAAVREDLTGIIVNPEPTLEGHHAGVGVDAD